MKTKLKYLGWASFLFTDSNGVTMVSDPFLAGDEELGIPKSPQDPAKLVVDLVLASHPARDHFEQGPQIIANSEKTRVLGDHSTLITVEKAGIEGRGELTTAGATFEIGDYKITAMDACHIALSHLPDGTYLTGEPLCYIIEIKDGPTVFFSGDTSITYEMKLWGEIFHPDYAILGIGGVELGGGRSLDEMNPDTAALCCKMLGVRCAIPMHYRQPEYLARFIKNLADQGGQCTCIDLKPGMEIELG